ncbi:hypothetical protein EH223_03215 [candidate division KSB1 bacterium]|nr:hypothetical protein [candidate division KSB1 bacterium]RQW06152.1 MAG: hypothetical protein EH223_03215 [candidate division KSB1 bacterium]
MLDIHAGYLSPRDADQGTILGATLLSTFDDAIDLGFGMDFFQKSYAEEMEVPNEEGTEPTLVLRNINFKRTILPLYASLKIKIPGLISRRNDKVIFGYFARASLSYQFLISDEKNYQDGKSEKRNYKGWGWQGGAGLFYGVGSRSTLIAEAVYNNCIVNRNVSKHASLLPSTDRVDLSGVGIRVGVELDIK